MTEELSAIGKDWATSIGEDLSGNHPITVSRFYNFVHEVITTNYELSCDDISELILDSERFGNDEERIDNFACDWFKIYEHIRDYIQTYQ